MKIIILSVLLAALSFVSLKAQVNLGHKMQTDSLYSIPIKDSACQCKVFTYNITLKISDTTLSRILVYDRCLTWLKNTYKLNNLFIDTQNRESTFIVAHPIISAYSKPGLVREQTPVYLQLKIIITTDYVKISWSDYYMILGTNHPYKMPVPYDYIAPNSRIDKLLESVHKAIKDEQSETITALKKIVGVKWSE